MLGCDDARVHRAGISYVDMMKRYADTWDCTYNGVCTKLYNKRLCKNIPFEIAIGTVATSHRLCVNFGKD